MHQKYEALTYTGFRARVQGFC